MVLLLCSFVYALKSLRMHRETERGNRWTERDKEGDGKAERTSSVRPFVYVILRLLCVYWMLIWLANIQLKRATGNIVHLYFPCFFLSVKHIEYIHVTYFVEHAVLECTANN